MNTLIDVDLDDIVVFNIIPFLRFEEAVQWRACSIKYRQVITRCVQRSLQYYSEQEKKKWNVSLHVPIFISYPPCTHHNTDIISKYEKDGRFFCERHLSTGFHEKVNPGNPSLPALHTTTTTNTTNTTFSPLSHHGLWDNPFLSFIRRVTIHVIIPPVASCYLPITRTLMSSDVAHVLQGIPKDWTVVKKVDMPPFYLCISFDTNQGYIVEISILFKNTHPSISSLPPVTSSSLSTQMGMGTGMGTGIGAHPYEEVSCGQRRMLLRHFRHILFSLPSSAVM